MIAIKTLKAYNDALDNWLIKIKIKSKPKSTFEIELIDFVQILSLNLNCGKLLEESLKESITSSSDPTLLAIFKSEPRAILAFNLFVNQNPSEWGQRLNRSINRTHITGSTHILLLVDKILEDLYRIKMQDFLKKSEKISIALTFLLMLSLISVIVVVIAPIILLF